MKIFAAVLVTLAVAGCVGASDMAGEGDSQAFPELVATWVWYPLQPFPIHDTVEVRIVGVSSSGR